MTGQRICKGGGTLVACQSQAARMQACSIWATCFRALVCSKPRTVPNTQHTQQARALAGVPCAVLPSGLKQQRSTAMTAAM